MSQRVFITGGASGLGRALAERWAREGARICIGDLHEERAAETLASIVALGGQGLFLRCDVTRLEDLQDAAQRILREWGGVDVVINNAGVATAGTIVQETLEQWQWVIDINLLGVVRGCQAFVPMLKQQKRGHIVNIASMAGLTNMPAMGSYCATKAAVIALSETLRLELVDDKIGVSVVCPSFFKTNLGESLRAPSASVADTVDRLLNSSPLTAQDVAESIYQGVRRRTFLILPHPLGRQAHWMKRFLPNALYLKIIERETVRFRRPKDSVRPGEELDIAAVDAWLKEQTGVPGQPQVSQYSGGASNWTYRLRYPQADLVLRRPPAGTKSKSAHDMGREYRLQKALKPVYPYVPEMLALCSDESVIGCEFYVMHRVDGLIPRKEMPKQLKLSRDGARALCLQMLDALIELHQVDYQAAGLANLAAGAGYARRQIEGWNKRYQQARTWNVPNGKQIAAWLEANLPARERICITHNDFRFDNLVLSPEGRIVGILDWELATLGDPLMDLGNLLAYWVQADDDWLACSTRRQPTHLPGMLTRREVIEYYTQRTGWGADNFAFYEVYGLFRLSGIAQQIYYRYHHKQTRNPAFRHFWVMVNYLHWRCHRLMKGKP